MKEALLNSEEPIIRYKAAAYLNGCDPDSPEATDLREKVRQSPRVQKLLSERGDDGKLPWHPYQKWMGAHWVLALLADCGYPPGDAFLDGLFEQEFDWILGAGHLKSIPTINGLVRRCASQESNALFAAIRLGKLGEEVHELSRRLVKWQWPDGGWNCDKHPQAHHSSFHESLIPMRALGLYAQTTGDHDAKAASDRAVEFFLRHELFKRESSGEVIHPSMIELHYPPYWHYDILYALKIMKELGRTDDPRCKPALDLLASRRLPDGGYPADARWYRTTRPDPKVTGYSPVDWGPTGSRRMNEFVTVDALYVLGC